MQSLSRFISGGSAKGGKGKDATASRASDDSSAPLQAPVSTSPTTNTGYLGPPLTAAESRKVMSAAAKPNPTFGRPEVKPKERRGSWHEGGEFLGV